MRRRALLILGALLLLAAGCAGEGASGPDAAAEVSAPEATYLYGEDGPPPPGKLPGRCPPPITGTVAGYSQSEDWAEVFADELGATACYGPDGPFRSCGDGIGDLEGEEGIQGGSDCRGEPLAGLPFAVPRSLRTSDAAGVFGGECLEAAVGDEIVLTDCRLPHVGRVIWGRAEPEPGQDLQGVCDANQISFQGFGKVRLIRAGDQRACIVVDGAEG